MPFIIGVICLLLAPFVLLLVAPVNLLRHLRDKGMRIKFRKRGQEAARAISPRSGAPCEAQHVPQRAQLTKPRRGTTKKDAF